MPREALAAVIGNTAVTLRQKIAERVLKPLSETEERFLAWVNSFTTARDAALRTTSG